MNYLRLVIAGFIKDAKLEYRTRYAMNAILMFAVITLAAVSFAVGPEGIDKKLAASFYWIVLFFSSMTGLSHIFVREIENKTELTLKLYVKPTQVFWAKFLFNFLLLLLLELIIIPLFFLWLQVDVAYLIPFLTSSILGALGLSIVSTLIAGIIAKAGSKSALFAILSFPIILPIMIIGIRVTYLCFVGIRMPEILSLHLAIFSFSGIMLFISPILFKFIWRGA
ncbi:MAG: heme exporter protein CcmB [Calditrichia bacterium]